MPLFRGLLVLSLISALIPGIWSGLRVAPPASSTERYVDKDHHFSFAIPKGWKRVQDATTGPAIAFVGPKEKGFAVNVNVYSEPVNKTNLAEFVKSVKNLTAKTKAIKLYNEAPGKLGGQPAYGWRAHLSVAKEPALENRQIVSIVNKRAFILTFTALPATIKKYDPIFDRLLASFHWDK